MSLQCAIGFSVLRFDFPRQICLHSRKRHDKGTHQCSEENHQNNNMGVDEFLGLFQADFDYNYNRLMQQDKKNQAMALEDKRDCIRIL